MIQASDFGAGFYWGAAAAAYQTEGAWNTDGKGPSIWDTFTARTGKIHNNAHGRLACDFYNRYIQDLILMSYLGIPNFRFSLSWPRIMPSGTGAVNARGMDFYDRLVDQCLEHGIQPWITLYHWDLPQALEDKGGWTNRDILNWFTEYTQHCALRLGDRVQHWMVLNEPMVFTGAGYFLGIHAPGRRGIHSFLAAAHHAVLCQSLGGRILRSLCPAARVGTTFSASHITPADERQENQATAIRVDALVNRMFVEPLAGMGYPADAFRLLAQMERYMHANDASLMPFNMDFIGVQNYTREVVRHHSLIPYLNARQVKAASRGVPCTDMGWEVYPEGIYHTLRQFGRYACFPELIVTENGAAFPDRLEGGKVHDHQRTAFLQSYLEQVLRARNEGVPVNGYFVWSFTDNFEWAEGFSKRFGLVYVDYATRKRYVKDSGFWYRQFLNSAQINLQPDLLANIRA